MPSFPRYSVTAIKLSRHSGMDRRNPDCRDANNLCHPWSLGSGDPCRNDEFFLNLMAVKLPLGNGVFEAPASRRTAKQVLASVVARMEPSGRNPGWRGITDCTVSPRITPPFDKLRTGFIRAVYTVA